MEDGDGDDGCEPFSPGREERRGEECLEGEGKGEDRDLTC